MYCNNGCSEERETETERGWRNIKDRGTEKGKDGEKESERGDREERDRGERGRKRVEREEKRFRTRQTEGEKETEWRERGHREEIRERGDRFRTRQTEREVGQRERESCLHSPLADYWEITYSVRLLSLGQCWKSRDTFILPSSDSTCNPV